MRVPAAIIALAVLSASPALSATVGIPAVPYVDITMDGASARFLLPAADATGAFQGRGDAVLCDGSVLQGRTCANGVAAGAVLSYGVTGSVFPFIDGTVSFFDAGTPTTLTVTFGTLIPAIVGPATTVLQGEVTVPADRDGPDVTSPLPGGSFFQGLVFNPASQIAAQVGSGAVTPDPLLPLTTVFGPVAGTFDCGGPGGCEIIALAMGINGQGGSSQYTLSGRFDVDAVSVVPLPATGLLLLGALGLAGAVARRRRA